MKHIEPVNIVREKQNMNVRDYIMELNNTVKMENL